VSNIESEGVAPTPTTGTQDDDDDRDDEHEGENEASIREVDEQTEARSRLKWTMKTAWVTRRTMTLMRLTMPESR